MLNKSKILILFPEGNLPYSPSTINFASLLSNKHCVTIAASENRIKIDWENKVEILSLDSETLTGKNIFRRFADKIFGQKRGQFTAAQYKRFKEIKKIYKNLRPDKVIAVDSFALECCRMMKINCLYFSLEINSKLKHSDLYNYKGIESVIIQSRDRYNYLFGNRILPVFLLPNSPIFSFPQKRTSESKNLVYNGYIWSAFGPQFCLNFISKYPEFYLQMKGVVANENMLEIYYPYLLNNTSVSINSQYLTQPELAQYLSNYSIGFCFYNFEHPYIKDQEFNYRTAPSGKLFQYLAAGLPVICSNIPAFTIINEYSAGVLIDDYSPDSIKTAIEKINEKYNHYSQNALGLASDYCFKKYFDAIDDNIFKAGLVS